MDSDAEGRPVITFMQHTFTTTPEDNNIIVPRPRPQDSTQLVNPPPHPSVPVGIDAILGGAKTVFNGCTVVLNVNMEKEKKSENGGV